ncbi:MAG: hypothetical protein M3Q10_08425 [Chloroflexota bacterium]|nr:hypothetical protein [Chloroflexota bacterium]
MEGHGFSDPAEMLTTRTPRWRALAAVGNAGAAGSSLSSIRRFSTSSDAAHDPVIDAGRRLTAAVHHNEVPLPTVRLPIDALESTSKS